MEPTTIHYELSYDNVKIENDVTSPSPASSDSDSLPSPIKADKTDCLIAAASGVLTGALDILWVGKFSLNDAQALGREQVNQFVELIAHSQGCVKEGLDEAIKFLEKKYKNPSDKLTPNFGGGLQHHLRDFSHHPSPVGLACSILTQFTGRGHGTDTDGAYLSPEIPENVLLGETLEQKILFGVLHWALHIVSDMAGSSNSAGSGTGVPGPLISILKEVSALPLLRDIKVNYKEDIISLSQWISKLFNGTAFAHTNSQDLVRFDLRTELGITNFTGKQTIPVIINQCIFRTFYLIRRLFKEAKSQRISSIKGLFTIDPRAFMPFNNRCISRMSVVASGTFSAIDSADAAIRARVMSGSSGSGFVSKFLLRINFVGIAIFALAIKNDTKYIISDIKNAFITSGAEAARISTAEHQIVEITADMDNSGIYRYRMNELIQMVRSSKEHSERRKAKYEEARCSLFDVRSPELDEYNTMAAYYESWSLYAIEKTITTIFDQNNISYEHPQRLSRRQPLSFILEENGLRVGYMFRYDRPRRGLPEIIDALHKETDVDRICCFFAMNPESKETKTIISLYGDDANEYKSYIHFGHLKEYFDEKLGAGEYELFMRYVDELNERAKTIIAHNAVSIPSEEEVAKFKRAKLEMLCSFNFESQLPSDMYVAQKEVLRKNFFDRKLYKVLIGNSNFADSFIASEWNYNIGRATGVIEKTSIVAGYLKSVEQLLFTLIKLYVDRGLTIRMNSGNDGILCSDNLEHVNSTLGSLTYFIKNNGDQILDVNKYTQHVLVDKLFAWTDDERNGHFHKHNLFDWKKIDEIRAQTLHLYYLILGSFTVRDDDLTAIGMKVSNEPCVLDDEALFDLISVWASPILLYDVPKDSGVIGFHIAPVMDGQRSICIQALKELESTDYTWNHGLLYTSSAFNNTVTLLHTVSSAEEVEQIIRVLEYLYKSDTPAGQILRSFPKVAVGGERVYRVFEERAGE